MKDIETRYKDNENGTITDTKTCLIWQAEHVGPMPWQEAMHYAEILDLCGSRWWRLPTIEELFTLVDFTRTNPASAFPGAVPYDFWSLTLYDFDKFAAWHVNFNNGRRGYVYFNYCNGERVNYYARCVRGE